MRALLWAGAVSAVLGLGLAGCSATGDVGSPTTQQRQVAGVTSVVLATSGDLEVVPGDSPSLTITAGEGVIDDLTSEVSGGRLELDHRGSGPVGQVRYRLTLPRLDGLVLSGSGGARSSAPTGRSFELTVAGSGEVTVDNVTADRLMVELTGSGSATLSGSAAQQAVRVTGSGDYSADGLRSEVATVAVSGSGDATVDVARELTAQVSGSGDITYHGDPRVTSQTSGSGEIRRD